MSTRNVQFISFNKNIFVLLKNNIKIASVNLVDFINSNGFKMIYYK